MVVADWIVLVSAGETFAAGNGRAKSGEFLVVPPGVLHEKNRRADNKRYGSDEREPAKSTRRKGRRQKIHEWHRENRHPPPGELYEAQFREQLPEDRRRTQHEGRGYCCQKQEHVPNLAAIVAAI